MFSASVRSNNHSNSCNCLPVSLPPEAASAVARVRGVELPLQAKEETEIQGVSQTQTDRHWGKCVDESFCSEVLMWCCSLFIIVFLVCTYVHTGHFDIAIFCTLNIIFFTWTNLKKKSYSVTLVCYDNNFFLDIDTKPQTLFYWRRTRTQIWSLCVQLNTCHKTPRAERVKTTFTFYLDCQTC